MKLARDEMCKVAYYKDGECIYYITCRRSNRNAFFLYEAQGDGSFNKVDKGDRPDKLVEKHKVEEKMRGEMPLPWESSTPTQAKADETDTTPATRKSGAKAKRARSHRTG